MDSSDLELLTNRYLGKKEAERCDAYVMFGVALSLDSCTAFTVLGSS